MGSLQVSHDLGHLLGKRTWVAGSRGRISSRVALVFDALKAGQVDLTFTNATGEPRA